MSELRIRHGEWPSAVPASAHVGDEVSFVVRGRVFSVEEDLVDTTPLGGPISVVPGDRTTRLLILDIAQGGVAV